MAHQTHELSCAKSNHELLLPTLYFPIVLNVHSTL